MRWPSGQVQTFPDIVADRRFVAAEGVAPLQIPQITPRQLARGTTATLRIGGAGLSAATAVGFSPSAGIRVVQQLATGSTLLDLVLSVDASAAAGHRDLTLTNPDGQRATRVSAIELK